MNLDFYVVDCLIIRISRRMGTMREENEGS